MFVVKYKVLHVYLDLAVMNSSRAEQSSLIQYMKFVDFVLYSTSLKYCNVLHMINYHLIPFLARPGLYTCYITACTLYMYIPKI